MSQRDGRDEVVAELAGSSIDGSLVGRSAFHCHPADREMGRCTYIYLDGDHHDFRH